MRTLASFIEPFPTPFGLNLRFVDVPIRILTNAPEVCARLRRYYAPYVRDGENAPLRTIRLIQGASSVGDSFEPIARGAGKSTKEAARDVIGGRLIRKLRTGVLIGMGVADAFAIGDLGAHLNQAINLINNCYAKIILKRGYVLLHASAVSGKDRTVALAGLPGAGKSTAALHLVEESFRFVSNDRLLARGSGEHIDVLGYPKQPRVNPGTLLNHPRLVSLLPPETRAHLRTLTSEELWTLEQKVDVDLDAIYGPGTVALQGTLTALVLLKWNRTGKGYRARRTDGASALSNAAILRRDLGVFDLEPQSRQRATRDRSGLAEILDRITVIEVTGGVDFAALVGTVGELVGRR